MYIYINYLLLMLTLLKTHTYSTVEVYDNARYATKLQQFVRTPYTSFKWDYVAFANCHHCAHKWQLQHNGTNIMLKHSEN